MGTWNSPPQIPPFKQPPHGADQDQLQQATIAYLKQLANIVSAFKNDMEFMINGNLDVKNIRAKSVTADRMDVDELSAITANLGHIISGLIESIEIFGSYISTNRFGYPKAEMSNTQNLFKASSSLGVEVAIESSSFSSSSPSVRFSNLTSDALMSMNPIRGFVVVSNRDVEIASNQILSLNGGQVRFQGGTPINMINQPFSTTTTVAGVESVLNLLISNLISMKILA